MKCKAHGAQKPRYYAVYSEVSSTAQRRNSPAQTVLQEFPTFKVNYMLEVAIKQFLHQQGTYSPSQWSSLAKHPLAAETPLLLPPFCGEMGIEIKGILATIEPWLRAGWKIPARKVELYPDGCAFSDPEFFARIDSIMQHFKMRRIAASFTIENNNLGTDVSITEKEELLLCTVQMNSVAIKNQLCAEREIKKAWFDRYASPQMRPTRWHSLFTESYANGCDEANYMGMMGVPPSYQPSAYTQARWPVFEHIGVQLRHMPWETSRNSKVEAMATVIQALTKLLKLPVLIYGLATDSTIADYQRTLDIIPEGVSQLSAELSFLRRCRLMLSPDSGWTDLMGWLRVPTLLQEQAYAFGVENLRLFKPKFALLPTQASELPAVVEQLLSLGEHDCLLPDPYQTSLIPAESSPNSLANSQRYLSAYNK